MGPEKMNTKQSSTIGNHDSPRRAASESASSTARPHVQLRASSTANLSDETRKHWSNDRKLTHAFAFQPTPSWKDSGDENMNEFHAAVASPARMGKWVEAYRHLIELEQQKK